MVVGPKVVKYLSLQILQMAEAYMLGSQDVLLCLVLCRTYG